MVAPVNTAATSKRRTQRVRNGKILTYRRVGEMADSGPDDQEDDVEGLETSQPAAGSASGSKPETPKKPAEPQPYPASQPASTPVLSTWLYTTESNLGESWPAVDLVHELQNYMSSYVVKRPKGETPDAVKIRISDTLATIADKLRGQIEFKSNVGMRPFLLCGLTNGLGNFESLPEILSWLTVRADWGKTDLASTDRLSRSFEENITAELHRTVTSFPHRLDGGSGKTEVVFLPEGIEDRLQDLKERVCIPKAHMAELAIYCALIKQPRLDEVYVREMKTAVADICCRLLYREGCVRGAIEKWKQIREAIKKA